MNMDAIGDAQSITVLLQRPSAIVVFHLTAARNRNQVAGSDLLVLVYD
jgi:hypothetical protein